MSFTYRFKLRAISAVLFTVLASASSTAFASAFQLFEQNGVGTGNFDAGAAAEASDASTAWYNPAGLVMLDHQQLVLSAVGIDAGTTFTGNVQNYITATLPFVGEQQVLVSNEYGSANGGGWAAVPSFYYALPINNRVVAAVGVVVPFGLQTDYPTDSVVRYSATLSKLVDIDLTPSIGVKITDKFSVGAGLDFQHIDAQFNQDVGLGDLSLPGLPDDTDTQSMNDASDWAWGWHAGILYQFTPSTRVGLAYHSKVNVNADGTSTLKGPLSTIATGGASDKIVSNDLTSQVTLPAFTTLSIYHDINDRWAVMGSVNYTQWNVFGNIPLDNAAAIAQAGLSFVPATTDVDVPQNFHNTWRVATGVNYRASEKWLLRAGAGVDEDPTNNTDRNVRLPDATRYNVAIGAHYQANKRIGIDAGWTHLFVPDAIINQGQAVAQQYTYVNGTSENSGNIIGAQLTWNIT